jgi:predicted acylesterase/phospholipase RssA
LILAGGGTKVAFQAGVLQVWLDEAGLSFDHADGASGGVFNLAMWAQGMSGRRIADNWRRFKPGGAVQPNVRGLLFLPTAPSLFKLDRFRRNVLAGWELDWAAIRATQREATFNLYDFTCLEQVVVEAADMDEDRLISAVSLPVWFPPVPVDGHTYIDAVYATDANLEEGIRRGADELWVIWTISQRGVWRRGLVSQYFQIIEAAATSQLKSVLARIERSNAAFAEDGGGEFGRPIAVKLLQAEVPAHYLLNFRRDRVAMAVELGVAAGRRWCAAEGLPLGEPDQTPTEPTGSRTGLRFSEQMTGFAAVGETNPTVGARVGARQKNRLFFELTIHIDDLATFVAEPRHQASATGWVEHLGHRSVVGRGRFNLFVDQADPARKRMLYELPFQGAGGVPLTLLGYKVVVDDPGWDVWSDTTTLYTRVLEGHVSWDDAEGRQVVAAGILHITPRALLRQVLTFRGQADTLPKRLSALSRFGQLFLGQLWDVYVSPSAAPPLLNLGAADSEPGGAR